jgi:hypothetical protein
MTIEDFMNASSSATLSSALVFVNDSHVERYPSEPPFHPDTAYREYKGALGPRNPVYAAVRDTLRLMKLDPENEETDRWNPLKTVVFPGDRVVLKPDLPKAGAKSGSPTARNSTRTGARSPR